MYVYYIIIKCIHNHDVIYIYSCYQSYIKTPLRAYTFLEKSVVIKLHKMYVYMICIQRGTFVLKCTTFVVPCTTLYYKNVVHNFVLHLYNSALHLYYNVVLCSTCM